MPVVDRREFGGRFTVKENAQRLANYRYLEVQLMELLGGWSHTTPQLAFKATFGYHVYDHAQSADMLGERLEQLRSGRFREEPATDAFAELCEYVWHLDTTLDTDLGETPCRTNPFRLPAKLCPQTSPAASSSLAWAALPLPRRWLLPRSRRRTHLMRTRTSWLWGSNSMPHMPISQKPLSDFLNCSRYSEPSHRPSLRRSTGRNMIA